MVGRGVVADREQIHSVSPVELDAAQVVATLRGVLGPAVGIFHIEQQHRAAGVAQVGDQGRQQRRSVPATTALRIHHEIPDEGHRRVAEVADQSESHRLPRVQEHQQPLVRTAGGDLLPRRAQGKRERRLVHMAHRYLVSGVQPAESHQRALGHAGSPIPSPASHTASPPTTVASTSMSASAFGSTRVGSSDRTARSASVPGPIHPLRSSS